MDFAENYGCTASTDAVQSSYWNQAGVTIHACVVYFKDDDGGIQHKGVTYVSDCNHHNSGMVFAILRSMHDKELKSLINHKKFKFIHCITYSPYSQH